MATLGALITLALLYASGTTEAAASPSAGACPGPAVGEFTRRLEGVARFDFDNRMLPPFEQLWRGAERPALPAPPDSVSVFAAPNEPLLVLYGRGGCVLGLLRTTRPVLWQAMRAAIGPAV